MAATYDEFFSMDENGSATEWEVSYGAAGFTGSGTGFSFEATSLSLTGLTENTSYDVYVRSVCAVGRLHQVGLLHHLLDSV